MRYPAKIADINSMHVLVSVAVDALRNVNAQHAHIALCVIENRIRNPMYVAKAVNDDLSPKRK